MDYLTDPTPKYGFFESQNGQNGQNQKNAFYKNGSEYNYLQFLKMTSNCRRFEIIISPLLTFRRTCDMNHPSHGGRHRNTLKFLLDVDQLLIVSRKY